MARRFVIPATVLIALGALVFFVPWLGEERGVVASTPAPPGLFGSTTVKIEPEQNACLNNVTFDERSELARFLVGTYGKPGPKITVTLEAGSYRSVGRAEGYPDNQLLTVPIEPPEESTLGTICITNLGETPLALGATIEPRSSARPDPAVNNQTFPGEIGLSFLEAKPRSLAGRVGDVLDHMSAFRPLEPWLLWPLLLLTIVGIPALAVLAVRAAFSEAGSTGSAEESSRRSDRASRG